MSTTTRERPVINVSELPTVVFGNRSLIWWGTIGLMMIEGTMFAIVVASYFYLRTRVTEWPPGIEPPILRFGIMQLVVFLVSVVPNQWVKKAAEKAQLSKVRIGLVFMCLIGVVNIWIRVYEFPALKCSWDANAYASAVWTILGLHTVHLVTDWFDSVVLVVLIFRTDLVEGRRFMDVSENADYWYFVVFTWVPIWAVIYLAPRLL